MAIPKNSRPTLKGWVHVRTGELLKAQKMTQSQINDFYGITKETVSFKQPQMLNESPSVERTLHSSEVHHHYGFDGIDK